MDKRKTLVKAAWSRMCIGVRLYHNDHDMEIREGFFRQTAIGVALRLKGGALKSDK